MLTDEVCRQITNTVKTLRLDYPRLIMNNNGQRGWESLAYYQARVLAPGLAQHFPHEGEPVARDTVGLMAYLGPPEGPYPPQSLREACLRLVRQYTAALSAEEHHKKLVQVVLAYGCQWQRTTQSGVGRWDEHWPEAVKELTDIAYNFVRSAINTLEDSVRDFRTPDKADQEEYAVDVVGDFVSLWPAPDSPKYTDYQTIHTWDPDKGILYGWLQHAVQGLPGQQERFPANMFTNGLLFPRLREAHHLAAGPIAFRQCRHCGYPPEEQRPVEYHRDSCAHGQVPYTPTACRFTHQDLLFMPEVYLPHPFRRCINHKDEQGSRDKKKPVYYDVELRECPDCHQKLSQTPTHLFVLHMWAQGEALSKEQKVVHKDIQKERHHDSQA